MTIENLALCTIVYLGFLFSVIIVTHAVCNRMFRGFNQ